MRFSTATYRRIKRWPGTPRIGENQAEANVLDEPFSGVNIMNSALRIATPGMVAEGFNLFRKHWRDSIRLICGIGHFEQIGQRPDRQK